MNLTNRIITNKSRKKIHITLHNNFIDFSFQKAKASLNHFNLNCLVFAFTMKQLDFQVFVNNSSYVKHEATIYIEMYMDEEVRKFHGHFTSPLVLSQTPCWREAFSFICMKATKIHCMPTFSPSSSFSQYRRDANMYRTARNCHFQRLQCMCQRGTCNPTVGHEQVHVQIPKKILKVLHCKVIFMRQKYGMYHQERESQGAGTMIKETTTPLLLLFLFLFSSDSEIGTQRIHCQIPRRYSLPSNSKNKSSEKGKKPWPRIHEIFQL